MADGIPFLVCPSGHRGNDLRRWLGHGMALTLLLTAVTMAIPGEMSLGGPDPASGVEGQMDWNKRTVSDTNTDNDDMEEQSALSSGRRMLFDGARYSFQVPAVPGGEPDCFVEIRLPTKVGGKCRRMSSGTPYCFARGFYYLNHNHCLAGIAEDE